MHPTGGGHRSPYELMRNVRRCDATRDGAGAVTRRGQRWMAVLALTIESVLVLNRHTLIVANDNTYPFSAGRRPGEADDNELIQIHLPRALPRT
jgi:hypothetical protein